MQTKLKLRTKEEVKKKLKEVQDSLIDYLDIHSKSKSTLSRLRAVIITLEWCLGKRNQLIGFFPKNKYRGEFGKMKFKI